MAYPVDWVAMAKGYPVRQESSTLPECAVCGSRRFRQFNEALRCEDCHAALRDPFAQP